MTYHRKASRCTVSSCTHRYRRRNHVTCFILFVVLSISSLQIISCRAEPVSLTDKTFDNVREAFNYPSMLILSHSNKGADQPTLFFAQSNAQKSLEEFRKLSNDQLLKDKDIMLVTVDATNNRMLAARMGVPMNELPSLIFLYSDRIFRYQGDPTSLWANTMKSYALQGYLNQGMGEPMLDASYWLLIKTKYLDWLFNGDGNAGNINLTAIVFSGFVVGLLFCAVVAIMVSVRFKEEEFAKTNKKKKRKKH